MKGFWHFMTKPNIILVLKSAENVQVSGASVLFQKQISEKWTTIDGQRSLSRAFLLWNTPIGVAFHIFMLPTPSLMIKETCWHACN